MNDAPLMVSISGLRGVVGSSLVPEVAGRYAAAIAYWAQQTRGRSDPLIAVGRDSRPSGTLVEMAVVSNLVACGCRVVRLGICSTPGIAVMLETLDADAGVVITASHNPIIWNGIKALRHDGTAPPVDHAKMIVDRFHNPQPAWVDVHGLHQPERNDRAAEIHVSRTLEALTAVRSSRADARPLKVVIDSVHGAGGVEAAMLCDQLGVERVHLYEEPTGQFPHTPEPVRENLTELCEVVKQHKAAVGFAQDPDADRLALVDEQGTYIGEEYTLALCAKAILRYQAGPLAANLSTSRMIDDVAKQAGQPVYRTPVGEAHVAAAMREQQCVAGGEGNGGIIWPDVSYIRDSIVGMAWIVDLLQSTETTLSEQVATLPRYTIVKEKLPLGEVSVDQALERVAEAFAAERIDQQDGIRIDRDEGWLHVRPSNTEPIVRIIAEAGDASTAQQLVEQARGLITG